MEPDRIRRIIVEPGPDLAGTGVDSVALEGEDALKNRLVVIGTGVDVTGMTKSMRKKVGHTEIKSVSDVEEDDD
ncbi:heavy metal-associated isoprenylated plant protein 47 [Artemisia annua]|uniref:Heavy metal-associated isoprenylated plant protein 47 n=1 Tax=Artemisia annua TaxID=35608 RepID=A0A2U1PIV3_ARTAN|nr:heavy metal-associated isoprenylated plant protein 47 [Artemisia annua]